MNLVEAFEVFPEVHKAIIIKSDVIRSGLKFTLACLEEVNKRNEILFKGYMLFSYDFGTAVTYGEKIPTEIVLEDGTEDGTTIQVRTAQETPYKVDYIDGEYWLTWNGKKLGKVWFDKAPQYYSRTMEDGTPMAAVVCATFDLLFLTANKHCDFFSGKKQCLFCDLTTHAAVTSDVNNGHETSHAASSPA